MIDGLERFLNSISDQDWSWWPLLGLRPSAQTPIDRLTLCKLSLLFGPLTALLILLLLIYRSIPLDAVRLLIILAVGVGSYSLLFALSFRWAWNRRARRLGG
ncbi:hypothetical protein [Aestuariirhabdus litorea]|uniref:Uncharacterized protein n=1 Tax=Aestuariirhabdus litorea TaxID=2528527 RepID=A0A3P3VUL5_9GAMM|nr:hypothetical protein [Aestuariirhabdus litorea]RRJ85316.1 hypothetical protein D0544_09720 [Aestuariirhabdus litorea]RWW98538.1 hypothetical protein DZC74_09705 [Endozoicomonadaceae bacterium GTF-13]